MAAGACTCCGLVLISTVCDVAAWLSRVQPLTRHLVCGAVICVSIVCGLIVLCLLRRVIQHYIPGFMFIPQSYSAYPWLTGAHAGILSCPCVRLPASARLVLTPMVEVYSGSSRQGQAAQQRQAQPDVESGSGEPQKARVATIILNPDGCTWSYGVQDKAQEPPPSGASAAGSGQVELHAISVSHAAAGAAEVPRAAGTGGAADTGASVQGPGRSIALPHSGEGGPDLGGRSGASSHSESRLVSGHPQATDMQRYAAAGASSQCHPPPNDKERGRR